MCQMSLSMLGDVSVFLYLQCWFDELGEIKATFASYCILHLFHVMLLFQFIYCKLIKRIPVGL